MQIWSQRHALAHSSNPHAVCPAQSTSHSPGPHAMVGHANRPMQVTSQLAAAVQSMSSHPPGVVHSIVQSNPGGQTTRAHRPPVQSMAQVRLSRSHVVHSAGHPLPGPASGPGAGTPRSTQKPRVHTRPASQSAVRSHAKPGERRSTEQLGVATAASAASARLMRIAAPPALRAEVGRLTGPPRASA